MFDQIVWWSANAMEVLLLVRSVQEKFCRKYPTFYLYLSSVLLIDILSFVMFLRDTDQSLYQRFYWYTQVFIVLVGCAVIVEIYRRALADYPGVARLANGVLLSVFIAVVTKAAVNGISTHVWSPAETTAQLERNLRMVQSILLVGIVSLLTYYRVPVGRNVKGIISGYGLYVCASVMALAFGSDPKYLLRPQWRYVQPIAYLVALAIWCATLWSYQPNPKPKVDSRIEHDYEVLARQTIRLFSRARSYLIGVIRP